MDFNDGNGGNGRNDGNGDLNLIDFNNVNNGNNGNNGGLSGSNNLSQPSKTPVSTKEEALKKIRYVDSILEPGSVKKYFKDESLTDIYLKLKAILRTPIKVPAKSSKLLILKAGIISLKDDMKDMSKDEIKNKKLYLLLLFIEDIINKLEGKSQEKESQKDLAIKYIPPGYFKEQGKGLKIMTLPILLAQKKAGNNSQKLNNEIRQIIYSLYNSKNMSKTVYNHLMNSI